MSYITRTRSATGLTADEIEDAKRTWSQFGQLLLASPVSITYRGFVFEKVWNWLIATQFHVPQATLIGALGISLLSAWMTPSLSDGKKRSFWYIIAGSLLVNSFTLLTAYVLTWFL